MVAYPLPPPESDPPPLCLVIDRWRNSEQREKKDNQTNKSHRRLLEKYCQPQRDIAEEEGRPAL